MICSSFKTGGNPGVDDWIPCPPVVLRWLERNCRIQEFGNVSIWEPCNYVSNLAYYRTTTEICARQNWRLPSTSVKAIIKAFASLATGSCFKHGSNTHLGDVADVRVNDLFGWIVYQSMVEKLTKGNHSIVHDLAYQPR